MTTIAKPAEAVLFDAKPDVTTALRPEDITRSGKSSAAFRTISEVADELGVQQHVLRFWETKFSQIKPLKRGGGRRYYRPEDVQLLRSIHRLLYTEGYTIKGVQKLLRDVGKKQIIGGFADDPAPISRPLTGASDAVALQPSSVQAPASAKPAGLTPEQRVALEAVLEELKQLRGMIKPR